MSISLTQNPERVILFYNVWANNVTLSGFYNIFILFCYNNIIPTGLTLWNFIFKLFNFKYPIQ